MTTQDLEMTLHVPLEEPPVLETDGYKLTLKTTDKSPEYSQFPFTVYKVPVKDVENLTRGSSYWVTFSRGRVKSNKDGSVWWDYRWNWNALAEAPAPEDLPSLENYAPVSRNELGSAKGNSKSAAVVMLKSYMDNNDGALPDVAWMEQAAACVNTLSVEILKDRVLEEPVAADTADE